ncbi:MAG: transcriptional regulator, TetR family protein [Actinomycetia bacterium]|nr:transcriptional regulator, TetR family protein [Actinomycetes bacterium]
MMLPVTTSSPARRAPRRTPAPDQRQVDADRTRAALLDAALEEFAAKGYAGARVRDIAQRAGVSKDLVAYHFGGKDGLYLAVQQAWLRREDNFADPAQPLTELLSRYLHDALADPRPMRLLAWRGLASPDAAPPDGSPPAEDLQGTRDRQQRGELPADIDPAVLRLVLLAVVAAPVVFPGQARKLFGAAPGDPEFEERYAHGLQRLISHLSQEAGR